MAPNKKTDNDSNTKERQPPPTTPRTTLEEPFPYTFTAIIEADHQSLNRLAGHVVRPTLRAPTTRLSVLTTLLWRLIRHDISEELVMRPAFATYLGDSGAALAAEDRRDHAVLKDKLLALYESVSESGELVGDEEVRVVEQIKALAAEMGMHMNEESGVVLPRFETVVDRKVSLELGRRYARTLVLTPEVGVLVERTRRRCFEGVLGYAKASVDELREILRVLEQQAEQGLDDGYLERRVREEMAEVRLVFQSVSDSARMSVRRIEEKL